MGLNGSRTASAAKQCTHMDRDASNSPITPSETLFLLPNSRTHARCPEKSHKGYSMTQEQRTVQVPIDNFRRVHIRVRHAIFIFGIV